MRVCVCVCVCSSPVLYSMSFLSLFKFFYSEANGNIGVFHSSQTLFFFISVILTITYVLI